MERMQLPVLIVGGRSIGGLHEVRTAVESGELFQSLSSLGVSFRKEAVVL